MSRSGYSDDGDQWGLIKYRGQVASAIRGKRGQAFLRELIEALDAMPEKRLIADELQSEAPAFIPPMYAILPGSVCALGSVGLKRGVDLKVLDPRDHRALADVFGVAHQLICEVEFENDEALWRATPEARWRHMRDWAARHLIEWDAA